MEVYWGTHPRVMQNGILISTIGIFNYKFVNFVVYGDGILMEFRVRGGAKPNSLRQFATEIQFPTNYH